jgi:ubiquinone/menaquinone biosynthesis C-methylase UbiE
MKLEVGKKITNTLPENYLVLDIGGWWQPFPRADYVLDAQPFHTRNQGKSPFTGPERFTPETWIVSDVNSMLPFKDKEFDFVICSHVLEDIRDPIHLLKEISRVGKAGYVECPSRFYESINGLEGRGYVGLYHHRWFVELDEGGLVFRHKPHSIHGSKDLSIPKKFRKRLTEENSYISLFWNESIQGKELVELSMSIVNQELKEYASSFRSGFQNTILDYFIWNNLKEKLKKIRFIQKIAYLILKRQIAEDQVHAVKFYSN